MVEKGPLTTMKIGSTGMSTSHWYAVVALWFAPGTKEGHGTARDSTVCTYILVSKSDSTHGIQGYYEDDSAGAQIAWTRAVSACVYFI